MNKTGIARAASLTSRRVIAVAIGLSLALSAGIHAFVVDAHLREWWAAGAFFIAAAIVQAVCAYMVLVSRDDRAARWGAIVSALLVTAWVVSRTVGVPFGPGRGVREAVGGLDMLAASAEIFAVGAYFALRTRRSLNGLVSRTSRVLAVGVVGLTFGLGAATAAAMPAHSHSPDAARSTTSERHTAPQPPADLVAPTKGHTEGEDAHPHDAAVPHEHPEER